MYISPFFIFQDLQDKHEGDIGAPDPLDVDNKKMADNINSLQQQQTTQYGSIPNGTAATEGNNHKINLVPNFDSTCNSNLFYISIFSGTGWG